MEATLYVHNMSIFRCFKKNILGFIKKWNSEAALSFEFYPSDWHFRLSSLQFLPVTLSVMEIKPYFRLFYRVVKNLGRPRPLRLV